MSTSKKRQILVTGAAGRVGTAFYQAAGADYDLYLADKETSKLHGLPHQLIELDTTDPKACLCACQGMDTVLHLAANPNPEANFESLLAVNILGTHNVFQAAKAAHCRRVVFASSAQAVEGYPLDVQVTPHMLPQPKNLYGVSKCFGESLASYFAYQEGLPIIAVRIACFEEFMAGKAETARDMSAYISRRDLVQLLVRCIEAPLATPFAIVHGVSNNRFKRLDLTTTTQLLGYAPQDDSFELLGFNLMG
ncbi:NAD-dependent epimerase/dehydratase family protein [Hymenobacter terrenus]|uniref:NAD-dependent epimerase/dehydratase family protein n=1 Tax=Hymenobacter terrenus TaxID=1629124 RepID=UPI000619EC27|nr:NAD(P)-dependent oxidoreductase [Hymenobacter terrenus]